MQPRLRRSLRDPSSDGSLLFVRALEACGLVLPALMTIVGPVARCLVFTKDLALGIDSRLTRPPGSAMPSCC